MKWYNIWVWKVKPVLVCGVCSHCMSIYSDVTFQPSHLVRPRTEDLVLFFSPTEGAQESNKQSGQPGSPLYWLYKIVFKHRKLLFPWGLKSVCSTREKYQNQTEMKVCDPLSHLNIIRENINLNNDQDEDQHQRPANIPGLFCVWRCCVDHQHDSWICPVCLQCRPDGDDTQRRDTITGPTTTWSWWHWLCADTISVPTGRSLSPSHLTIMASAAKPSSLCW